MLLASSIGTVNADVIDGDFAKYLTAPEAAKVVKAGTYYQLATATTGQVIAMVPNRAGDAYTLKVVSTTENVDVRYTLWTIDVQGNPTDGYRYTFVNLGANMILAVDPATALKKTSTSAAAAEIKGDISVWKWQEAPDPVSGFTLSGAAELTSVFGADNDSTVTLVSNTNGVYAVKYALNNKAAANLGTSQIAIVPAKPKAVVLGVDDLNSMLWSTATSGKLKLTFDKDVEGGNPAAVNLFTKQNYKAVPAIGYPANYGYVDDNGTWQVGITTTTTSDAKKIDMSAYSTLSETYLKALATETLWNTIASKIADEKEEELVWDNRDAYNTAVFALHEFISYTGENQGANHVDVSTKAKFQEELDDFESTISGWNAKDPVYVALKQAFYNYVCSTVMASAEGWVKTENVSEALTESLEILFTTGFSNGISDDSWNAFPLRYGSFSKKVKNAKSKRETSKAALDAKATTVKTAWDKAAKNAGWVSLQANYGENETPSYLKVGTEFLTGVSGNNAKHQKIVHAAWADAMASVAPLNVTRMDLNGRYNFQFTWFPAEDSIVIRTGGFAVKPDNVAYWTDMTVVTNPDDLGMNKAQATPSNVAQNTIPAERNLVKIAILANNHREVTVGSSENKYGFTPATTINTRIYINGNGLYTKTTIPAGIYYFNLVSNLATRSNQNGKYITGQFCGSGCEYAKPEVDQTYGTAQNFDHMPRTQWVVEQNAGPVAGERTVNIYNREFPALKAENVQVYTDGNGNVFALYGGQNTPLYSYGGQIDTVRYTTVENPGGGYFNLDEEDLLKYYLKMDYYSGLGIGHKVDVSAVANDSVVFVNADDNADGVTMQLEYAGKTKFGYKNGLTKYYYRIKTYDSSKLANNNKYIHWYDGASNKNYVLSDNNSAVFYLKENNELTIDGKSVCYYALVEADDSNWRVGVSDGTLEFTTENACSEDRVATFALTVDNTPYYRRLGVTNAEDGFEDLKPTNAKIFDAVTGEYLYCDNSSDYSKGKEIDFLGIENKKVNVENPTLYIDTAYVRDETMMPQYLIAVNVTEYKEGKECPYDPEHNSAEYLAEHPEGCPHAIPTQGYKIGRYLINFTDSVKLAKNSEDYQWDREYTRLGFVEAKHIGDTLVIFRNGAPGTATADSIFLGDNEPNKQTWSLPSKTDPSKNSKVDTIRAAHKYGIKNAVFAFRLVDDEPDADFLIEATVEEPKATMGGWIKNQNGVPVIAKYGTYNEAALDALVFNIETSSEEATANETITASEVKVIAGEGRITVAGAAGKKVVITNILGQTVANTVLISDNESIAAPRGVVVVAIEGEEAVKAIVK